MLEIIKPYFNSVRKILCRIHQHCFIVAGMPRCGTTLMCTALTRQKISYYRSQEFLVDFDGEFSFSGGVIYKTHTPYPPLNLPENAKIIYVFGDPRDAAISIHKNLGFERAYVNAHSTQWGRHDDVFSHDVMRLEENFDNWCKPQSFSFAAVKYDAIYEINTICRLQEFLGAKLNLPKKRVRESGYLNHPRRDELDYTYGRLSKKVFDAPPVKVWEAE